MLTATAFAEEIPTTPEVKATKASFIPKDPGVKLTNKDNVETIEIKSALRKLISTPITRNSKKDDTDIRNTLIKEIIVTANIVLLLFFITNQPLTTLTALFNISSLKVFFIFGEITMIKDKPKKIIKKVTKTNQLKTE